MNKKNIIVLIRLSENEKCKLAEMCEDDDTSMSVFIRSLIRQEYISRKSPNSGE